MMRTQKHHPLTEAKFLSIGNAAGYSENTAFSAVKNVAWFRNESFDSLLVSLFRDEEAL